MATSTAYSVVAVCVDDDLPLKRLGVHCAWYFYQAQFCHSNVDRRPRTSFAVAGPRQT